MGIAVRAHEPLSAHVGVPLGGGDIGVSKQLLDCPQVGASIEQMGGKGVPKGMRVCGRRAPAVENSAHISRREVVTTLITKELIAQLWRHDLMSKT